VGGHPWWCMGIMLITKHQPIFTIIGLPPTASFQDIWYSLLSRKQGRGGAGGGGRTVNAVKFRTNFVRFTQTGVLRN
jgi:hypothetical protein